MEVLLSLLITALAMLGIGAGLLFGRGAPSGSCGGLGRFGRKVSCRLCGNRKNCRQLQKKTAADG